MASAASGYWYLTHQRGLPRPIALLTAVILVITPAFVFLATSTVMSECVFTLVQLLAIVLVGSSADGPHARRNAAFAGTASAAAMLIRSAGVGVIAAGLAYLAYRRQWRRAVVFAATALVCLSPWLWLSSAHAPTMAERLAQGGGHALTYSQNFWLRWASHPLSGTIDAADLPGRVVANVVDITGRDVARDSGSQFVQGTDGERSGSDCARWRGPGRQHGQRHGHDDRLAGA